MLAANGSAYLREIFSKKEIIIENYLKKYIIKKKQRIILSFMFSFIFDNQSVLTIFAETNFIFKFLIFRLQIKLVIDILLKKKRMFFFDFFKFVLLSYYGIAKASIFTRADWQNAGQRW